MHKDSVFMSVSKLRNSYKGSCRKQTVFYFLLFKFSTLSLFRLKLRMQKDKPLNSVVIFLNP